MLVRAEADELRERAKTHAIFERMETQRAERERLAKVVLPASQRAARVRPATAPKTWVLGSQAPAGGGTCTLLVCVWCFSGGRAGMSMWPWSQRPYLHGCR